MAGDAAENYSEPVLEGTAGSDYERYLNTEELLALLVERLAQKREDASQLREPRRIESRAVPEHLADLLVLPRGHVLEHVELGGDELEAKSRAPQKPDRGGEVTVAHDCGRSLGVVPAELEPELRRLVRHLEEQLVAVHPFGGAFLEREQLLRVQVALVVGGRGALENRLGVVLDGILRHGRSILVA